MSREYRDVDDTNPSHYRTGSMECIDLIREQLGDDGFLAYCLGNRMKYVYRAGYKPDSKTCMEKAEWYMQMVAHVRGEGPDPRDP
jgi:hypothetical protein